METALIFLIWALFASVSILTLLIAAHISVLTSRAQAQAEAIRADTKFRSK